MYDILPIHFLLLILALRNRAVLVRGTQRQFLESIYLEDDLSSRTFGTFVVKFLACARLSDSIVRTYKTSKAKIRRARLGKVGGGGEKNVSPQPPRVFRISFY